MRHGFIFLLAALLFDCGKHNNTKENSVSDTLTKADSNLLIAQQNFLKDSSEKNCIWLGRRLAYLNRFDEAIKVYSTGLIRFPNSYKLYRHRGHRFISIRKFDNAIRDLQQAARLMPAEPIEIEPDGIPNKLNQPISSTQFNVWYHLGLAYYLKGDFQNAIPAYQSCMAFSNNDDLLVATTDWLYMALRRTGNDKEARKLLEIIPETLYIIENDSYFRRLKMYKGELSPDSLLILNPRDESYNISLATQGYGVGNWYLYNYDTILAKSIFQKVVSGPARSAFGYIAAEADLTRLQ